MNLNERIKRAEDNASASFRVGEEADDEARGAQAIGLEDHAADCRDRARRHSERCAIWSATAAQLRDERAKTDGCGFPIDEGGESPPDLKGLSPHLSPNGRPS